MNRSAMRDPAFSGREIPGVDQKAPHGGNPQPHKCARARSDYDDDIDIGVGSPRRSPYENPTNAGMIGFIAALVSLGLLLVVLVLFIFLKQEDRGGQGGANIERTRLLYYWFLLLDVLSFFAALTATILGARGSSPSNPLYRGYGIAALVMGIFEIVITIVFSFYMMCAVMLVAIGA